MDVHPPIGFADDPEESMVTEDGDSGLAIKQDPFFWDVSAMVGLGVPIGGHQD